MKKRTLNRKRFEVLGVHQSNDVTSVISEVSVKFSAYTLGVVNHLVNTLKIDIDLAMKINNETISYLNEHLHCNKCDSIFEDSEFYVQKSQYANRHRATICKQCWKQNFGNVGNIK